MDKFYEVWTEPGHFEFLEYEGISKDSPFIGELRGEFFFPGKTSKNKNHYSHELWENVLKSERTQDMLKRRVLGGTIGHVDKDTDTLLREGELAFIITELKKEGDKGFGRALVLNNEVGRRLKLYLKAGMQLGTSTVGGGKVLEEKDDGTKVLDPKSYKLERIDVVILPAFTPEQWAQLQESVKELEDVDKGNPGENPKKEDATMEKLEKLLEEMTKEKKAVEKELIDAHKKVSELTVENENLKKELEELRAEVERLKGWEEIEGTPEEIRTKLEALAVYEELGTPDEIKLALEKSREMLEKLSELGTVEEIEEALQKASDFITKVEELGTINEIRLALERSEEFIQRTLEEKNTEVAESLSAKYGVSVEKVLKLIESIGDVEEIEEMLKELSGTSSGDSGKDDEDKKEEKHHESVPRAKRIVGALIKG